MGGIRKRGSSYEINYRDAEQRRHFETIDTDDPEIAKDELKKREGDVAHGLPVTPKMNTVKFIELARDVMTDYVINKRRSLADIEARFRLHILPIWETNGPVRSPPRNSGTNIKLRQAEAAKVGTINRELEAIRRAYCWRSKSGGSM